MEINDIVSLVLSGLSLILSIINAFFLLHANGKSVDFEIYKFSNFHLAKGEFYEFIICVSNKSRLPISINEIIINSDKKDYIFIKSPRVLLTKSDVDKDLISSGFPLNIDGLSSNTFFCSSLFIQKLL